MPDDIKHLRPEEQENYHAVCKMLKTATNRSIPDVDFLTDQKLALEALSACRGLLEKHQWAHEICQECEGVECLGGHAPDCAIAAQLKGIGGK